MDDVFLRLTIAILILAGLIYLGRRVLRAERAMREQQDRAERAEREARTAEQAYYVAAERHDQATEAVFEAVGGSGPVPQQRDRVEYRRRKGHLGLLAGGLVAGTAFARKVLTDHPVWSLGAAGAVAAGALTGFVVWPENESGGLERAQPSPPAYVSPSAPAPDPPSHRRTTSVPPRPPASGESAGDLPSAEWEPISERLREYQQRRPPLLIAEPPAEPAPTEPPAVAPEPPSATEPPNPPAEPEPPAEPGPPEMPNPPPTPGPSCMLGVEVLSIKACVVPLTIELR